MKRLLILLLVGVIFISGCTGETGEVTKVSGETTTVLTTSTTSTTSSTTSSTTTVPIKDRAIDVSYDELMRNSENYIGEIVYYRGQIVQVMEVSKDVYVLRVNIIEKPNLGKTIWVNYEGKRMLEDDIIDLWGKFKGLKNYESIFGEQITIPEIDAIVIEFVTKECGYGYVYKNNECVECGGKRQPCCLDNECDYGYGCLDGICQKCGDTNQICCDNDECNYGNICIDNECVECGDVNQQCCENNKCLTIYPSSKCVDGICKYCGKEGEMCCEDDKCNIMHICKNGICEKCGSSGQQCCGPDDMIPCYSGSCVDGICD